MNPEVPTPETPVEAPSEQPTLEGETPVVPEVNTEVPTAPASEEAQSAERLIGPSPGTTEEDVVRNAERIRAEREAEAAANPYTASVSPASVNTPPVPPAPLPNFHTAEEQAVASTPEGGVPVPVETPVPTEASTPESQE